MLVVEEGSALRTQEHDVQAGQHTSGVGRVMGTAWEGRDAGR